MVFPRVTQQSVLLHIVAENKHVNSLNKQSVNQIHVPLTSTEIIDLLPENVVFSDRDLTYVKTLNIATVGNLTFFSVLKLWAKFMLTCNIDIDDRINNRQVRNIMF